VLSLTSGLTGITSGQVRLINKAYVWLAVDEKFRVCDVNKAVLFFSRCPLVTPFRSYARANKGLIGLIRI